MGVVQKTGISKRTVYRYMPQELKNPERVENAKKAAESRILVPAGTKMELGQVAEAPVRNKDIEQAGSIRTGASS